MWEPRPPPVASLSADDEHVRAAMDAMLVTSTPARISEYVVRAGDEHVTTVRADGVVIALPAGHSGCARAADDPVVAPEAGVVAVVPVAPFATDPDHWVVPIDGLSVTMSATRYPSTCSPTTAPSGRSRRPGRAPSGRPRSPRAGRSSPERGRIWKHSNG